MRDEGKGRRGENMRGDEGMEDKMGEELKYYKMKERRAGRKTERVGSLRVKGGKEKEKERERRRRKKVENRRDEKASETERIERSKGGREMK
ncbi:hypothetical protein Pcinc_035786 [Petrolisthes cinctipes]|uniref:Uncharacterized protein n=1 Tax=Petrolisthes cinctipes TaxID=88211 RepID=A0AAE1EMM2_PETCI|nr:hypothetical protein Pcinc_035786 [Petrolisthes cinctipes]